MPVALALLSAPIPLAGLCLVLWFPVTKDARDGSSSIMLAMFVIAQTIGLGGQREDTFV
jgi:hypothetical protein